MTTSTGTFARDLRHALEAVWRGEEVGITRRGVLVAEMVPAPDGSVGGVSTTAARSNIVELIERVCAGEEITLTAHGRPVAVLRGVT